MYLLTGCTFEGDATVVAIFAVPSSSIVNSGDKIYIDTQISTLNSTLTNVSVTSFDREHGETDIFSTNPGTKTFKDRIIWEIPSMTNDTTLIELVISATDNANVSNDFKLKLKAVGGTSSLLEERSSITIYSPQSGKHDAFSFVTLQSLHSLSEAEDCDLVFIMPAECDGTMPLTLGTKTDIVFSRANSFDYSSATKASVQAVFNSSLHSDTVDNISIDDIIIIGRETHKEDKVTLTTIGVLKVMAIYDENDSLNDRIVFNLKAL